MQQKIRFHSLLFSIISLAGLLQGCADEGNKALPGSTGKAGEVIVVMDDKYWERAPGKFLMNTLAGEYPALPQPEPAFDLVHLPGSSFKGLFITHRNIILFTIGKNQEPAIREERDKWATSQVVLSISAPSEASCVELLGRDSLRLESILTVSERTRLRQKFMTINNEDFAQKLTTAFGIRLDVPKDYALASEKEQFIWFRKETPEISQGIFVYTYPMHGGDPGDVNRILSMRDSVTAVNIPGPLEGSHMGIMHDFPARVKTLNFGGTEVIETRGLWNVVGDFMGGPYISLSLPDRDEKQVICIEGYLYAPKFDKRNYLRQVEAILYSLQVGGP